MELALGRTAEYECKTPLTDKELQHRNTPGRNARRNRANSTRRTHACPPEKRGYYHQRSADSVPVYWARRNKRVGLCVPDTVSRRSWTTWTKFCVYDKPYGPCCIQHGIPVQLHTESCRSVRPRKKKITPQQSQQSKAAALARSSEAFGHQSSRLVRRSIMTNATACDGRNK